MRKKKIFILLPDGVGLRNFAFTSFVEKGKEKGWDVVFWNQTLFPLKSTGFKEVSLTGKPRAVTDLFKRAKIRSELYVFQQRFNDPVYADYIFAPTSKGLKAKSKNALVFLFTSLATKILGVRWLRDGMKKLERRGSLYHSALNQLAEERPDFIFCTNQRSVNAIGPLTAAQYLNIPTGTFIFSWDNLPKATLVVDTDFYFVWSEYMKKELHKYYEHIREDQMRVTGTPQFEPHYNKQLKEDRASFYKKYELDPKREYLCFSGDDITTSPHDEFFLEDVAEAVNDLNKEGFQLGIIFRRCPTDFSGRYQKVVERYKDLIVEIAPLWEEKGNGWNRILPTKEDLKLQTNIVAHTFMVVNVASSMIFDYVAQGKPCAYINYNPDIENLTKDVTRIYSYVHFRSMPSDDAVIWINKKEELTEKIRQMYLKDISANIKTAEEWFKIINLHPSENASERIWREIENLNNSHK